MGAFRYVEGPYARSVNRAVPQLLRRSVGEDFARRANKGCTISPGRRYCELIVEVIG